MIDGVVLGVLTFIGLALLYVRLPSIVKRLIVKLQIVFDIAASVGVYFLLGNISGSMASATASAVVGILISICLVMSPREDIVKKTPEES